MSIGHADTGREPLSVPKLDGAGARARALDPARLPDHFDRLCRAAFALCGTREDAEDLVQETYARVLRRPRWLRRGGELAYLLRVLRNTWHDTVTSPARRRVQATPVEELEFVVDPRADLDELLDARAAYAAIAALSAPLRETIVAVDIVGLSYREAAHALGTREGTITSRLHRARLQVADALEAGS
jgi:RNA polymerase sigma-70 factor (ECF subfamily)